MERFRPGPSLLTALVGTLLAANATAQTTLDPAREKRRVQEEKQKTGAQQRGITTSKFLTRALGRTVTYDEVLKDPDNVELNLGFARTQIRAGDLNGATATLERVLLINPKNLPVRILYAVVLYRLDARNDAEREIRIVLKYNLPGGVRAELSGYLSEITLRNKRTRWVALFHTSYQFETNRNSVPGGRTLATPGGLVRLNGKNQATADNAFRGLVRISVEHKIGGHRGHKLLARVGFYHSEQLRLDRLTLSLLDFEGGFLWDLSPVQLRTMVFAQHLLLSHESFLASGGVRLQADWWLNKETTVRGGVRFDSQHFREIHETTDQARCTGPQISGLVSVRYKINAQNLGTIGLRLVRKTANVNYWRYYGAGLFARHQWFLGRGMYLLSTASWTHHIHDGANLRESANTRRQHYLRVGTTFGVPLATLLGKAKLPKLLQLINLSLGVSYERSLANIPSYRYGNWRITFGITRRFTF